MGGINVKNESFRCFVCGMPFGDYDAVQKHYRVDHIKNAKAKRD
jgi:hypothetical protein